MYGSVLVDSAQITTLLQQLLWGDLLFVAWPCLAKESKIGATFILQWLIRPLRLIAMHHCPQRFFRYDSSLLSLMATRGCPIVRSKA